MEKVLLRELKMNSRKEVITFLKRLWNNEKTNCPMCGTELELLHKKAKKSNDDYQCKKCNKVFRTFNLLRELNEQMPN